MWRPIPDICSQSFFGDLPADTAKANYTAKLVQANHNHCTTPVRDPCWSIKDLPKTYIITKNDNALAAPIQMQMLKEVQDESWTVYSLASGHSPFLTRVHQLVETIMSILQLHDA